ncbi:STAS domain-containing protein [Candidatus Woesearchaeota archaeon]|nr:STAS domain-containing protein [Candidatus Woesearchaeota archaeon]
MAKKNSSSEVAISRRKIGGEAPMVVAEVTDSCLYTGFFGTLDSARMRLVTEKLLEVLERTGINMIIIDLSNIDIIDSAVAAHLVRVGETMRLVGTEAVFCGVMPVIAQTMINAGVEFKGFRLFRDFKSCLKYVLNKQGLMLVPFSPNPAEQAQQQQP